MLDAYFLADYFNLPNGYAYDLRKYWSLLEHYTLTHTAEEWMVYQVYTARWKP